MAYTPQAERERQERKSRMVTISVAVFIILTLVFSTLGFFYSGQDVDENKNPEYDYNGIKFVQVNGIWTFSTPQGQGTATFLPTLVKDIKCVNCEKLTRDSLRTENSKVYVVAFTQQENQAASELTSSIQLYTNIQRACLQEQENDPECLDLPLKSCKGNEKIFIFKEEEEEKNETLVIKQENCLFIKGNKGNKEKSDDLIKAADRAIYQIYGVLK